MSREDDGQVFTGATGPEDAAMAQFEYEDLLPVGASDTTPWKKLTSDPGSSDWVSGFEGGGESFVRVDRAALTALTRQAMHDIAHLLRPAHLAQLAKILEDPEASPNDRFVALDLLKNANIAAGGVLPMWQDTGTAIVMGKKGQRVVTRGADHSDEEAIARGVFDTYAKDNLRYSQLAPLSLYEEKNTGTNLPAQIEIYSSSGPEGDPTHHEDEYHLLFIAKGGGSANKSYLYQETQALLNEKSLMALLDEKLRSLGTGV